MECCYIIRRSILSEESLDHLETSLSHFHHLRKVFEDIGVREDGMSLPRQHALDHYPRHIREFGAPNGLCSSITESKHIKAVKEPWRRSNRFEALGQMLLTNQRLDKISAARNTYEERGMLKGSLLSSILSATNEDCTPSTSPDHPSADTSHPNQDTHELADDCATENEDEDDDTKTVKGPRVMATVVLAQQPGRYTHHCCDNYL